MVGYKIRFWSFHIPPFIEGELFQRSQLQRSPHERKTLQTKQRTVSAFRAPASCRVCSLDHCHGESILYGSGALQLSCRHFLVGISWGNQHERFWTFWVIQTRHMQWNNRGVPQRIFEVLAVDVDQKNVQISRMITKQMISKRSFAFRGQKTDLK